MFFALALFLEIRLAVWVTVGLVVSFVGVLTVMLALDIAINTISLFVFALAIGIIVDDAIVVAEHVHQERKRGTPGVTEIRLALRPEARTLGLTLEDLALQARAAFFGTEALRLQRGREEVRVYVRLPAGERNAITDIEGTLIRTPGAC